jgi:serine/threonine protein kinase
MSGLPKPGDVVDGKYRIEREIGRGGMAVVFAATQLLARREVAMKWLLPQVAKSEVVVARFLREAQAAARIDHPNVVSVLDVGRWETDGFYLVMEMLQGEDVRERLDREGPIPLAEALSVGSAVVGGVYAAHRVGVVHRDIKPENVFLRKDERGRPRGVKILDFGISKLSESESITLTGSHFGTAHYLAPEQAAGVDRSSPRIDLYQIGVLFYEMLSGRRPYEGDSQGEVLVALMSGKPPSLAALRPELPAALCELIDRAMAREPSERHADLLAFAQALRVFARLDEELDQLVAMHAKTQLAPVLAPAPPTPAPPVARTTAMPRASNPPRGSSTPPRITPSLPSPQPAAPGLLRWGVGLVSLAALASLASFATLVFLDRGRTPPHRAETAPASIVVPEDAGADEDASTTPSLPMGIDPPSVDAGAPDTGTPDTGTPETEAPPPEVTRARVIARAPAPPPPPTPPTPPATGVVIHEATTGMHIVPVETPVTP